MNKYLEIGTDEFRKVFAAELADIEPGRNIRTAGRPTKAMPNGEDRLWWENNGPAMVQSWITWRQNNPNLHILSLDGVPAIELEVHAEVDVDGSPVLLRGFIDRVFADANTGELLIVDLKGGRQTPAPLQLGFYRRALKATHGLDAQYGAYWMAREGTLSAIENLDAFSDEVIDYWVATTYRGIQGNIFLPHVTALCKGCGVRQHCYVFNTDARFSPVNPNMPQGGNDNE